MNNKQIIKNKQYENKKKSTVIAYLILLFTGFFGFHRLYIEDYKMFGIHLFLLFMCFQKIIWISELSNVLICGWLLVDLFWLYVKVKSYNDNLIKSIFVEDLDSGV